MSSHLGYVDEIMQLIQILFNSITIDWSVAWISYS